MKLLKTAWILDKLKTVNVGKAINDAQLRDKKNIILDQLLLEMSVDDSISLFKSVKEDFDKALLAKEGEADRISCTIKEYKIENIVSAKYKVVKE